MKYQHLQKLRARSLRRASTDAEHKLWCSLRGKTLGVKFRRQMPLGPYIVDFASVESRLIVELDGGQHAESEEDKRREVALAQLGYRTLRFWNHEVLDNLEGVLERIHETIESLGGSPTPTPCRGLPPSGGGALRTRRTIQARPAAFIVDEENIP